MANIESNIKNLLDLNLHDKRVYEDFISFTNENIVQNIISNYINSIFTKYNISIELSNMDYISLYMVIHYPNIMRSNDNIDRLAKDILNNFNRLHIDREVNVKLFVESVEIYKKLKTDLINDNKNKLIETYCVLYLNYEDVEKNIICESDKQVITKSKDEMYNLLKEILENDEDEINRLIDEKRNNVEINFYSTISDEYWETVQESIKNEKNEIILNMLDEILLIFKSFIPNNSQILQELKEGINMKYMKHIIEEKTINKEDIYNLFYFLVKTLKKFQCPEDDENLEIWVKKMEEDMNSDTPLWKLITRFFREFYNRLVKIKNRTIEIAKMLI
jgi:hypothetical protein